LILTIATLCHYQLIGPKWELQSSLPADVRRSLQQWNHSELYHEVPMAAAATWPTLPCEDIFKSAAMNSSDSGQYDQQLLCANARSCDGDWPSSVLLPLILCHGLDRSIDSNDTLFSVSDENSVFQSSLFIHFLLPPLILCYLYLLFRLLATTADSYFSPALETFSFEMGLPPRFAGAVRT
jgi:hypothetical protein